MPISPAGAGGDGLLALGGWARALALALLVAAFLTGLLLVYRSASRIRGRRLRRALTAGANLLLVLAFVETTFFILTAARLARSEPLRRAYAIAMRRTADRLDPGVATNYTPHHYLNYALDPQRPYLGRYQYDERYRIRRSEPVRPRDQVAHRLLALGGSTTFCEQIADEEDTWPRALERLIRERSGEDRDVINGGVGGYNVVENTIHYLTLLAELDPDLVLLYVGINDVHPRLYPEVRTDYSRYRIPWRPEGSVIPRPHPLLRRSHVYDYYYLTARLAPIQASGIHGHVSLPYPDPGLWRSRLEHNPPLVYEGHLRNLVRLLLAQGKQVVLLPQYFVPRNESDAVYALGVRQHNDVGATVAAALGVPYLAAVVEPGSFALDDTFDSCHFNAQGSRKMAALIDRFLDEQALLPTPIQ